MVPKFDGGNDDDIEKFFKKLEEYTYNYNDEEKLLCLKWLLEGTAREFMENSSNWTYNNLKGALFKIFKRVITREDVYRKLRARTLKASESCISYIISMQTIASQAKIEGQELVDIIIDGMQDSSNNISLLYGSTTVEKLITCVDRYEKRRNRLYEKRQGKTQVKKPSNNNNQDSIRCFNCSQFGHMKSSCPKPIRPPGSCFICQQMGHIHKNCPNRQNISASVFPEDVVNSNEVVVVDPMLMEINNTDKISLVSKVNVEGNSDFQLTDTQELSKDFINYNSKLSDEQILKLNNIIDKFYINPTDIIRKPHNYRIKIRLSDDVPVYCSPRRLSVRDRDEVQKITSDLLNRNIIRPSSSPHASAIVLTKKKSGETRMCVDYSALNKKTIRDNFPLPLIEDCIEYVGGKKWFTLLDLKYGFYHIEVEKDSIPLTSFVTPHGQYEYLRMPFGLKNAPANFQRFVTNIFRDLIDNRKSVIYIDDILIASTDFESHLQILTEVLKRAYETVH
ncbi:uncharacterized protein LOC119599868 [Lucilia sericata]|uniref:uncharacterized protein LOC119599868 n=1 Tax=Lucilia sericata TaxID=13632 RepID=UPI0018A8097C|nr:uncharacterized protein LOC119599868 [Lucilia sericata]